MSKKKRHFNKDFKRMGEIMEEIDTPHGEFNLTKQFQQNGASAPRASQPLLHSFRNAYEPVDSEHLAHELFTMGRLREDFQAYIVPKMPDPLPGYLEELDYMGYPMRASFDGSPCIMVRYRGAIEVHAEEVEDDNIDTEDSSESEEPFVYTDDWTDDLSDLPPYRADEE